MWSSKTKQHAQSTDAAYLWHSLAQVSGEREQERYSNCCELASMGIMSIAMTELLHP